jgi:HSP20 family protein
MLSLRNALDLLLQDAFIGPSELFGWSGFGDGHGHLALDLYETENDCVVTASVPGVRPDDLDISVQGNVLTIRGESKSEEEATQGTYHLRERRYGSFERQIQLPVPVETGGAEARFENGILTLRLPKAEEAKERKIEVNAGSPAEAGKAA